MKFVVYNSEKERRACFVDPTEAAVLVSFLGDGSCIKYERKIVWEEGVDGQAGESYDFVVGKIDERIGK